MPAPTEDRTSTRTTPSQTPIPWAISVCPSPCQNEHKIHVSQMCLVMAYVPNIIIQSPSPITKLL